MKRRTFLISSAGLLLTPGFLREVNAFSEKHSKPLLIQPDQTERTLYAKRFVSSINNATVYDLWLDNDYEDPNDNFFYMTWREFAKELGYDTGVDDRVLAADLMANYEHAMKLQGESEDENLEEVIAALDLPADEDFLLDEWKDWGSPQGKAHYELSSLDLGPDPRLQRGIGLLDFIDSPSLGYYKCSVEAEGDTTLALLQGRLVELKTGIKVEIVDK